jgi:hypothetical protein
MRVVATVEGFSAPVAPAAVVTGSGMGSASIASPSSLSGSTLFAAPSAPSASISNPVERSAPAAAATPALAAASAYFRSAPAAAPASMSGAAAAAVPANAVPAVSALAPHEAVSAAVSHSRPESAREAAAIATVEGGVAGWTARSAQTLDGAPVLAAASEGTGTLERASARTSAETSTPEIPAPAGEAPSKWKVLLAWAGPILALAALVTSVDFGTKYFALHHLFTVFHEVAWRKPIIMALMPYIAFTAYKMRSTLPYDRIMRRWSIKKIANGSFGFYKQELSGVNTMIKEHPSLFWAVRFYDVSIALMLGGILGNGLDTIRLNGALDWIPLGRSLMNFADIAVLLGLSFFQIASSFFIKAAVAHRAGKPLQFSPIYYLGLPLAGVFVAWAFGSASGGGALDLAMKNVGFLYLMAFSMLIGFARFLSAAALNPFVKRYVAEEGKK